MGSLAFALLTACAADSGEPPGDVLLITIDTLRVDHLGIYGYERDTSPSIDRWFADGAVFERAYSTEAATSPSVVSMLSGRLPQEHGVRLFFQLLPEEVPLVPDLLPSVYQTAAFVSNMVLTDEAIGFADRFDHYDDLVDQRESGRRMFERSAEATTNAALLWLAQERDPRRPLFLWVHYIDPHGPYRPPPDWHDAFDHEGEHALEMERIPPYGLLEGVDDALEYVDRYDAEIRYADRQVGRLLDGYARNHDPEAALILLTADHGETMMSRERWFDHSFHVYEELVRVPLLVRGPGIESARFTGLVSGIDVAATILGFAAAPARLDGRSLDLGTSQPPDDRVVLFEASRKGRQWRGAIQGEGKWVLAVTGEERFVPLRRFYDLATDPGEARPLDWRADAPAARLLEELVRDDPDPAGLPSEYAKGMRLKAPKVAPHVSAEQLEALRALGYAE